MNDPTTTGLVQQFVERTGQLYSLPAVAAEVLRLTGEPKVDVRLLKDCLERDPALTTRILKVVNSSLFGLSRQVTDLGQALALLGTRPLKMLVLGFSLPKDLFVGLEASVLTRYWRHTLVKATAARELAQRQWQISGDEAFTAGLLQDIGVLALIQQLGPPYQQLLDHVQSHGGSQLDRELDVLGFDHCVLSARLLMHWELPAALCASVAAFPDETRISSLEPAERTLPQILHLAELLARLIEQPYGSALAEMLDVGGRYCGLTFERLQPTVVVLQSAVQELAEVLSLDLPAGESYCDLLIASQARLADLTATAVDLHSRDPEEDLLEVASELRRELASVVSGRQTAVIHRPAAPEPAWGPAKIATTIMPMRPAAIATAEPSLVGRVGVAIVRCRQARTPLTLALVEIDRQSDLTLQASPAAVADLLHGLRIALDEWVGERAKVMLVGDATFALVCENCPRSEAIQSIRQVLRNIKSWPVPSLQLTSTELTLSAGVATLAFPPRNFPGEQLIDAAQRCLSGALLSGGDTLKSIEF